MLGTILRTSVALTLLWTTATAAPPDRGKAQHVVIVVWDGMRPDFVTAEYAPTLFKLASEGASFSRNHAVYVSSTEVNGTALATGMYPSRSGIMANREYRPEIDARLCIETQDLAVARKGDALSGQKYLTAPTLPEILRAAGLSSAIAGTKGVALLWDRSPRTDTSITLFSGATIPDQALADIVHALGPFPVGAEKSNDAHNDWTTRALTEALWKKDMPALSVLWLSDPDFSQHSTGLKSERSLSAIKHSDCNLDAVLRALEQKGVRDKTDVFVVSDHGFSTINRSIDILAELKKAGFQAERKWDEPPATGDIVVAGNGGSVGFYVIGHDAAVARRLVAFLEKTDFCGVIFSREKAAGTFPLEAIGVNTPHAPDVLVSLRWDAGVNSAGTPGRVISDGARGPGQGTHASLSRFDLHNTLVANGPDFRTHFLDTLPSGNIDLAPTVLWALGVHPPQPMDGRVLIEALVRFADSPPPPVEESMPVAEKLIDGSIWKQYLRRVKVGTTVYFDEGNGHVEMNH